MDARPRAKRPHSDGSLAKFYPDEPLMRGRAQGVPPLKGGPRNYPQDLARN